MNDLWNLVDVVYERVGPVAVVRMNRPERLNALTFAMHRSVLACYEEINSNPEIGAAILTGTGRYFCAGRDIKESLADLDERGLPVPGPIDDPEHELFAKTYLNQEVQKPLIAAVNGHVFGGGLAAMLTCDMVIMCGSATITDGHARVNLSGLPSLLRYLPPMIAREVAMSDRRLTPEECLRWGLVNYVVSADEVMPKAISVATRIAEMGPDTVRRIKAASLSLQEELGQLPSVASIEVQRQAARDRIAGYVDKPQILEGMRAFTERRDPSF